MRSLINAITKFAEELTPAWLGRGISFVNRHFTTGIVIGFLVLGGYGATLFIALHDPQVRERAIPVQRIDGDKDVVDPSAIYRRIRDQSTQKSRQIEHDPQKPLWVYFNLVEGGTDHSVPLVLDIRSVPAKSYRFWLVNQQDPQLLIEITDFAAAVQGGIYVDLPPQSAPYNILGTIDTKFLFKPKVLGWEGVSAEVLQDRFAKNGAAYWSVFLALAAFSLCVAIVNRSFLFVLFAAWLIASIRMAGFNNGWDLVWLGSTQWEGLSLTILRMGPPAYAFLTCALFLALFSTQKTGALIRRLITGCTVVFASLIVLGELLPVTVYAFAWRSAAIAGLLLILSGAFIVLKRQPSATAWLYAGSYGLMIAGMMAELLFQANILTVLSGYGIGALGGALASAVVMGVALAARIREAQQRELNALRELEGVYSRSPVGLFSIAPDGNLMNANPAFRDMFGLGRTSSSSERFREVWKRGIQPLAKQDSTDSLNNTLHLWKGTDHEAWYIADIIGNQGLIEGSIYEVTARKKAEARLQYLASYDPGTGALNERGFNEILECAASNPEAATLGKIGLDHLEYLTKIHGTALVTRVLTRLIESIKDALPDAHVARINNQVYILAQSRCIDEVRETISNCFSGLHDVGLKVDNIEVPSQLTCGLCVVKKDNSVPDAILRVNMAYDLCANSPDDIVIAEDKESDILRELQATQVAGGLDEHIRNGRFFLVAQPIVDMTRKEIKPSFEVLLRMKGESGETILPAQFVPAAEKLGVMSSLDRFVLGETFRLVRQGLLPLNDIEHISINLSGSSLNDTDFLSDIYNLVTTTHIDLSCICFEVTETVALNSFARTKEFLGALQSLGAKTAIDDFGAGHSSIHYLSELSPNFLKLDGSLITKVLTHPVHHSFVEKMIQLAKEMETTCIAEFVESTELETALVDMGATLGQGYLYSKPMPIEALRGFCAEWAASTYLSGIRQQQSTTSSTETR